jgi:hypothetical protein
MIFNWVGLLMFAASIGTGMGIGHLLGDPREGLVMVTGGPLAVVFDLVYRLVRPGGHWFHPDRGGSLFYLPVWLFGIAWTLLGTYYLLAGRT